MSLNNLIAVILMQAKMKAYQPTAPLRAGIKKREVRARIRELREQMKQAGVL